MWNCLNLYLAMIRITRHSSPPQCGGKILAMRQYLRVLSLAIPKALADEFQQRRAARLARDPVLGRQFAGLPNLHPTLEPVLRSAVRRIAQSRNNNNHAPTFNFQAWRGT
ncbi:hypothetical protein PFICI_15262 [Pestalotiopsis fici W106-1]|uniref:Uncharacterized protein n=1 Tax=Pestalotiopsis fici (strain W106-1 / CGMCC3.15140) TaxID=1229662 RepID=W3WIU6_PESFW|nr:uncharacterized protein PFICI_15262 [Pestalotiopsis fici W106-1]ETS73087.1 hypothetical protein PFICI_15262 [Pestalotiopsis fici W106-1]